MSNVNDFRIKSSVFTKNISTDNDIIIPDGVTKNR